MAKQRKTYRKLIITTYLSGVWKGNERTKKRTGKGCLKSPDGNS